MAPLDALAAQWRARARHVIFDADFGDGARHRAVLAAWRADPQRPRHLHYIACAEPGAAQLPPGFHRMAAPPHTTLDLLCAAPAAALAQLDASIDTCLLDGMPAGIAWVRALARRCEAGTTLGAAHLEAEQIAALGAAGFTFAPAGPGAYLSAVFASRRPHAPADRRVDRPAAGCASGVEQRAIVLGAGLAGAAICERLCARGWQVTLLERHPQAAQEASGNHAGIFMPLLARGDNPSVRLTRAAFLYALHTWERLGGIGAAIEGAHCGVLQLARDAAHAQAQREIAARAPWPQHAQWLEAPAASALAQVPAASGAWLFPHGGWAHPASVCAALLAACGARLAPRYGTGTLALRHEHGQWQAHAPDGAMLARAPTLILANGCGALELPQAGALPLAPVRGQVTYLDARNAPALTHVLCGAVYVTPAAGGIVSVGASYDMDADRALRAASQHENLAGLRALLHDANAGSDAPLRGRVGFRCVAPDRLPLVGALAQAHCAGRVERLREMPRQDGLYGLLGLASRGLVWAPLAAELLAAQIAGEVAPLEANLVAALDPARFLLAQLRRAAQ
ncbi:MAG: FAD-dependent 5-carboxymethylaminomethyl-2-thiouridine(34) oxidoreductase MnmC [Pseudomonadota bacterium]